MEQRTAALGTDPCQRVEAFSRLYKDGTVYHSSSYNKALTNKRNDTICSFRLSSTDPISFGKIEVFVLSPTPSILLRKLNVQPPRNSLLNKAGHP